MQHELGTKQPVLKKIAIGFTLLIVILVCIAGPMLLFSTLNPVSNENPVVGGYLQFYIEVQDTSSTSV
jgi:Piezo non-specific cation channel, R-Ras-binding domain